MTDAARRTALDEIAFCEHVLAKGGATVLTETLRCVPRPERWAKYPQDGGIFDPKTGAQWFYHCHDTVQSSAGMAAEHGHFHCFVRPDDAAGPIHHLCAVGVDPNGRLVRLFTVNQWVVGDDWLKAEPTIALLPRFDVHMPQPNYLVNRWLTAVLLAYEPQVAALIRARDAAIACHEPAEGGDPRLSRALEVTAEHRFAEQPIGRSA